MNYIAKKVKDLKIGDKIYIHNQSKDKVCIGISCFGTVVELYEPSNCMGMIDFGISQSFDVYKKDELKVSHFISFTELPVIVGAEE